ncbi:hypothetical protein DL93DRAFT_1421072 [Clavulina sp. PMI_390]|nr:hypothetical protein DL93DRAFT_1421072 [Clavulina sp. PMI_390]
MFIHADEWLQDDGEKPGWAKLKDTKGSETNMRFFRYGRPTIPSGLKDDDKCGLIEVFPYGTVLAFTADAIIKDMAAVSRIIYNAGAHSFTILLHPHMLGLLEKLVHEDPHKRPAASLASFHIQSILRRGSAYSDLTITTCPPRVSLMTSSRTGSSDVLAEHPEVIEARVQYWRSQLDWSLKSITTPDKLVEEFASSLTEAYPNTSGSGTTLMPMPLAEMERSIASTLTDELMRMQRFPTMYTSYRRFILVHGGRGYDEPKNLEKCQVRTSVLVKFTKTYMDSMRRSKSCPWTTF